jgi:hypothetical protein
MTRTERIITAVATLIAALILGAIGYAIAEELGALLAIGLVIVLAAAFTGLFSNYVVLNEMEVGVVFDRHGNFVCFLDNDYGRIPRRNEGAPWYGDGPGEPPLPKPLSRPLGRHRINRATEVMTAKLRKGSYDASGVSKGVRTQEGIPIDIPWKVSFRIEVYRIRPGIDYKMARALPENADKMVAGRMTQIIQHVVGQKRIDELYAASDGRSAIQLLEDEVRQELLSRARTIGITGIAGNDLKIGPIELPAKIETSLRDAHQRLLYAHTLANALQSVQQALHSFSPEDIDRLTELERLRIIDEKTQSIVLSEAYVSSRRQNTTNYYDEVGQNNTNGSSHARAETRMSATKG